MSEAVPEKRKSDLPVRAASAVVMLAVAGAALWAGGWWWTAFVAAVALGVLWEWWGLVSRISDTVGGRAIWLAFGLAYLGFAAFVLAAMRDAEFFSINIGLALLLMLVGSVICVDVGAYFAGRTFGGPKIAPSISPSKTWAGLGGGAAGAGLFLAVLAYFDGEDSFEVILWAIVAGAVIAVLAQGGDFFESWMKRRAGVKDSSALIPGHGGLFDRVDGLLAVSACAGLLFMLWPS